MGGIGRAYEKAGRIEGLNEGLIQGQLRTLKRKLQNSNCMKFYAWIIA